jgi:hypothetical protein
MSIYGTDGPVRRWLDDLNTLTRVILTFVVIAIVVAVILWG